MMNEHLSTGLEQISKHSALARRLYDEEQARQAGLKAFYAVRRPALPAAVAAPVARVGRPSVRGAASLAKDQARATQKRESAERCKNRVGNH